jgi:collagen beta-1,O-galactosyltransferase
MSQTNDESLPDNGYLPIYKRENLGCFKVSGVRDSYLLDLNDTKINQLLEIEDFDFKDNDSWVSFYAKMFGIILHVCNREIFGYIPDIVDNDEQREESFTHLKTEYLFKGLNKTYNSPLPISKHIEDYAKTKLFKTKTKMGFDEIYIVNLERRKDRRDVITASLDSIDVSYKLTKAVDGRVIDADYIKNLGISVLPDYKDPYNDRTMNYGEIGCFLSHYFIWKEVTKLFFLMFYNVQTKCFNKYF